MGGIVKKIFPDYGFIEVEGKEDLFFHAGGCRIPLKMLEEGDTVRFNICSSDTKPYQDMAINVRRK